MLKFELFVENIWEDGKKQMEKGVLWFWQLWYHLYRKMFIVALIFQMPLLASENDIHE